MSNIPNDIIADMACGSGYGSMMLSEIGREVYSVDIDPITINEIVYRYDNKKISFICDDLLNLECCNKFNKIVSFETLEHFTPDDLKIVLKNYYNTLFL